MFEGVTVKKVQERLRGVEYIFSDEVSMVSCQSMYKISARLALAMNQPDEAFGGMNMIFAGDFAQLPPVRANALFTGDSTVSPILHAKMGIADQKNTIGKITWQQVTTVVILTQNMRQTADTPEDIKFRTALTNMRFASCTRADLEYLDSRTISRRPNRPTFQDINFRNVSMITALNAQKDKINEMGCKKFAKETGQILVDFFSDDTLTDNSDGAGRKPKLAKSRGIVRMNKGLFVRT
jgi:hypothetical protein